MWNSTKNWIKNFFQTRCSDKSGDINIFTKMRNYNSWIQEKQTKIKTNVHKMQSTIFNLYHESPKNDAW